jgi:hypothetical protein
VTVRAPRDVSQRLRDILTAVDRIKSAERQLSGADQARDEAAAEVAFDAVLYNLVVIGEAVNDRGGGGAGVGRGRVAVPPTTSLRGRMEIVADFGGERLVVG